jgi:hypothetical protein
LYSIDRFPYPANPIKFLPGTATRRQMARGHVGTPPWSDIPNR